MEEVLMAFVSKTLNMGKEQVAELVKNEDGNLKDDALQMLLEKDVDRVSGLKEKKSEKDKELFNNGYAKAKNEVLKELEKDIKSKFGVASNKKGIDLVADLLKAKEHELSTGEITEDQIKGSEFYRSLLSKHEEDKQKAVQELEESLGGQLQSLKREKVMSVISSKASQIIDSLNPVFSSDKDKARNQRNMIISQLSGYDFDVKENGDIHLLKDGKVLEDSHGHLIKFDSLVKEKTTNLFDLKQAEERSSAGSNGVVNNNETKTVWTGKVPTNDQEYIQMSANAKSLEEKIAIKEAYRGAGN